MLDKESGIKVIVHDPRPQVVQRPASGRTGPDRLQHRWQIETRLVSIKQRLAHADHVGRDQNLIAGHLCMLAATRRTLVDQRSSPSRKNSGSISGFDNRFVATDHDRQRRILGARCRQARDRRIDTLHASFFWAA